MKLLLTELFKKLPWPLVWILQALPILQLLDLSVLEPLLGAFGVKAEIASAILAIVSATVKQPPKKREV